MTNWPPSCYDSCYFYRFITTKAKSYSQLVGNDYSGHTGDLSVLHSSFGCKLYLCTTTTVFSLSIRFCFNRLRFIPLYLSIIPSLCFSHFFISIFPTAHSCCLLYFGTVQHLINNQTRWLTVREFICSRFLIKLAWADSNRWTSARELAWENTNTQFNSFVSIPADLIRT